MRRNVGLNIRSMKNLSKECLIQLTELRYDEKPFNQILKQHAKREMRLRLGKVTVADVLAALPVTTPLLTFLRASIQMIGLCNLPGFHPSSPPMLLLSSTSDGSHIHPSTSQLTAATM